MGWEHDEWKAAYDDSPVRRFAGGIEIVGDPTDALNDGVAERNTDNEREEVSRGD